MTSYNDGGDSGRDRVILAGVILALQIIGLIWLLLFAPDRLAVGAAGPATAIAPTAMAESPAVDETAGEQPDAGAAADIAAGDTAGDEATTAQADTTAADTAADATTPEATNAPIEEWAAQDASAIVLPPEEVAVDPSGLSMGGATAPEWLAQIVAGRPPEATANGAGFPPHLLLTFPDAQQPNPEPAAPDAVDLTQPQIRIVPMTALLAWLQARDDTAGQNALEALQLLLANPPADEASVPPSPLLVGADQPMAARLAFEAFDGGRGVGYIAHVMGDAATPVTNQSGLHYFFQGLTDDGRHYVFMSWPMTAAFLDGDTAGSATTAALASDPAAYYHTIAAQVQAAADDDLSPSLTGLQRVAASLTVGADAVRAAAQNQDDPTPASGTPEDAAGFVWNWTGSRGGDGDETAVARPPDYSLVFWPGGSFSFVADCNVGRGAYSVTDGTLSLVPGAMTRAACPPNSQADEFLQTLSAARALAFDESGDLILTLADGREAIFANAGPADDDALAEGEEQPAAADAGFTGLNLQWPGAGDDPEAYTLVLLPDGTFSFRADCNVGSGTFEYDEDGSLTLLPGGMTRAACPEGSQADAFLAFLNGVNGVAVASDGAVTMTTADGGSATFISAGPVAESGAAQPDAPGSTANPTAAPLAGILWRWAAFRDAKQEYDVPTTTEYSLTFNDDGTVAVVADCNNASGTYTVNSDATLTILLQVVTTAACPPGSLSDSFIEYLNQAGPFEVDEAGALIIQLQADGGTMTFLPME